VLDKKLFRYKEFTIPFVVYREGDLSREDFLQIVKELQDIQHEQHDSLMETLDDNVSLQRSNPKIYDALSQVTELFDEALVITEQALLGPIDQEDDLFEEAMETFKRGNMMLADCFYDLDEMWERSNFHGQI
jgi:hypothetical protein